MANFITAVKQQMRFVTDILFLESTTLYGDITMGTIVSQITTLTIVYSTVYSDADQRKHQSWHVCGEFTGERWIPRTDDQ